MTEIDTVPARSEIASPSASGRRDRAPGTGSGRSRGPGGHERNGRYETVHEDPTAGPSGDPHRERGARPDDGPLPVRREQLPLPRRDEQTHLEPQLRERDGAGSGTPFTAFGADDRAPRSDAVADAGGPAPTSRVAAFRAATRRAADGAGRRRPG